jgi:sugar/nucleoside kinase (ribokinase family)
MGIVPLDLLYTVERLPRPGEKVNSVDGSIQGGGPVPNTLTGLARLGMRTALVAVVGDDLPGRQVHAELTAEGIDCTRMIVKKRGRSAVAIGMVEGGSGRRTIALDRHIFINPNDLRTAHLPHPRLVHLDGRDLEACLKLARWARRRGIPVSFDIGSVRNDVSALMPLVDHLVVADAFAFPFTGARSARAAAARLAAQGPSAVVVTEGTRGATGLEGGRWSHRPAYRVESTDTTGAGDAFHAGYLYGLLTGAGMEQRLRLGAAVAALSCTRLGARTALPTRARLHRFLKGDPPVYA